MKARGAALVEALVALVVIFVVATTVGAGAVLALRADARLERETRAAILIEQLLDRFAAKELAIEDQEGEFEEAPSYLWTVTVGTTEIPNLDAVIATVSWQFADGQEKESLSVTRWIYNAEAEE